MNYLLDTHAFLWLHGDPDRIPKRVLRELARADSELFLSVASAQEIVMKHALGKLRLPEPPQRFVESRCADASITLLAIQPAHVWALAALPMHHRDPFDRLLVAQALSEGLTLVSGDEQLQRYEVDLVAV